MTESISDEALAARYQQTADRDALVELVNRYQQPIFNYLLRVSGDFHRAEEAAQETFVRMLRFISGWRSDLAFRPWIYRIALNTARTLKGREVRRPIPAKGADSMDPSDAVLHQELRALVEELPADQKEAVVLHYQQSLSHSEVAEVLEIPAGTVATRIHQALTFLRSRLAATGIAVAIVGVESGLKADAAVAAPTTILATVLRAAPKAAAGPAAVIGIGGIMASKSVIVIAVAVLCLMAGGLFGYRLRANRAELHNQLVKASEAPRARHSDPEVVPPVGGKSDESPVAKPTAAVVAHASKARRVASKYLEFVKMFNRVSDPRKPTGEETGRLMEHAAKFAADAELNEMFDENRPISVQDHSEFFIAVLEELGATFTDAEKASLVAFYAASLERQRAAEQQVNGPLERLIAQVRGGLEMSDALSSRLTPSQREKLTLMDQVFMSQQYSTSASIRLGTGLPGLQGVALFGASTGELVPKLIDSWAQTLMSLTDEERARVQPAAAAHVQRMSAIAVEIEGRYGADFMKILAEQVDANRANTLQATWAYRTTDPNVGRKLHEASLRLLEAELENRRTLAALLPARAVPILGGPTNVYLVR